MADQNNKQQRIGTTGVGINTERTNAQKPQGSLNYALNAVVENFDGGSVSYQNELGNELCIQFPEGYHLIGKHFIPNITKHVFMLTNPETGESEIGYMVNNDCIYHTYINDKCLNFNIDHPIHKIVHKITNCGVEIYWTDGYNNRRFLNLDEKPFKTQPGTKVCENKTLEEIDCNKLNVQPDFSIPSLEVIDVVSGGSLTAGTVQFTIQYSDAQGNGYTSFYSITNPTPIANTTLVTPDFNYNVGKSVVLRLSNLDITGYFQYYNLVVIKTINNIPSPEIIGTFFIDNSEKEYTYTGQNQSQIRLSINDIFTKFPYYDKADDLTTVQDILIWKGLTSTERISYQQIANKIRLYWQTWRIPATENYADEINATNFKGYMRDEIYPFEIQFLLKGGKETDAFHIPGRAIGPAEFTHEDIPSTHPDFIGNPIDTTNDSSPYWAIYNTAYVIDTDSNYSSDADYKGPYQYGEFAYWESTERYPCNEDVWGELANQPIRHHKFPDTLVSPIFENPTLETDEEGKYINLKMQKNAFFPIGIRYNISQIKLMIQQSEYLTQGQKDNIIGFKILRGNRSVHKSVIAKGMLRNVGKYKKGEVLSDDDDPQYTTSTTTTTSSSSSTTTTTTTTTSP